MKTILVLDDEPSLMKFMRRILEPYRVVEAATAAEALLLFIDEDCRIDLLISDVILPTLSGIQVALHVRSKLPDLPVILTSGYPVTSWKDRDCADLERLGSNSVAILQKPFQTRTLLNTVRELIREQTELTALAKTG